MKTAIKFINGHWPDGRPKYTEAAYKLMESANREGATVDRRKGGWTNFDVLRRLGMLGLVEARETGPRGGRRYHATRRGRYQLKKLATTQEAGR